MTKQLPPGASTSAPAPAAVPWWRGIVRRKGNIGSATLLALAGLACIPLVLAFSRVLALPGGESFQWIGSGWLRSIGDLLNQHLTLDWVPPHDRSSILYLVLLPTGAVLITLTRLTLGIRVLGMRAILMAIGFRASGLIPSLALLGVVIGLIGAIRPWTRRAQLPMYARISMILCMAALVMVGALMVGPWVHSDAVWSVAFFPVIIMAMFAEGIAKTIEQEDTVTAAWRGTLTISLALVIAAIGGPVSRFVYRFPELMLSQLIALVFIAEFLDARLLEEWPARLSRLVAGTRPWFQTKPKVAVVRSRDTSEVVAPLGRPAPSKYRKYSVREPVAALREQGFEVRVFEGDVTLFRALTSFIPPHPRRGTPGGIVFNLAPGVQGEGRFAHVPAMLELAGLPYTGPGPLALARIADRSALLVMLGQAAVAVPDHESIRDGGAPVRLSFPLAARPQFEPDARRVIVRDAKALERAVQRIRRRYAQGTVVEEIVRGRRISVSLLGNGKPEVLPLVECSSRRGGHVCPALLDETIAEQVRACARAAFAAAGCRDCAEVDIRLTRFGKPVVVEIRCFDLLDKSGPFVRAAETAGYTFNGLMRRIVDEAAKRYIATPSEPRKRKPKKSAVVSLADRRATAK
jgi:D-alanine-D-alanine ligase